MTREEMIAHIQNIGTCEDDAQRRTMLGELQQNLEQDYDSFDRTQQENAQYRTDNESLRSANMKLFLQVGGRNPEDTLPGGDDKPKPKPKFEDLFNEKGELK